MESPLSIGLRLECKVRVDDDCLSGCVWAAAQEWRTLAGRLEEQDRLLLARVLVLRTWCRWLRLHPVEEPKVLDLREDKTWSEEAIKHYKPTGVKLGNLSLLANIVKAHPREFEEVFAGFRMGFCVGYTGPRTTMRGATRIPEAEDMRRILVDSVEKEKLAGRLLGPLNGAYHGLDYVRTSPISVIPKTAMGVPRPGKYRLIHNLSWGKMEGKSVNDGISDEEARVEYLSFDQITRDVMATGVGCYFIKTDIVEAYRHVPIRPRDMPLCGMELEGEIFLDTRLLFGIRSGPRIFSQVADCLRVTFARWTGCDRLRNMLDDFFYCHLNQEIQKVILQTLVELGEVVGLPFAPEKTEGPDQRMIILGLTIDTTRGVVELPAERVTALKTMLPGWLDRDWATKEELQSLGGVLSFCGRAYRWGRCFTRRIFAATRNLPRASSRVRIDEGVREDIRWWSNFAPSCSGVSFIIDETPIDMCDRIWTDSSNWTCAGVWGDDWFACDFSQDELNILRDINSKELFAVVTMCLTFGHRARGKTLGFNCDNEATVAVIKAQRAKDPVMGSLLRELFFALTVHSFQVKVRHVPGVSNTVADALSRPTIRSRAWDVQPTLHHRPVEPVRASLKW